MSEKAPKPAKAKKPKRPKAAKRGGGDGTDPGVLGNLPASRPARIGGRSRPSAATTSPEAAAATATEPAAAAAKPRAPKAPAKRRKAGKAARSANGSTTAPRRAKATPASASKAATRSRAGETVSAKRPRPVRAGAPALADPIADARERAGRESPEAERRAIGPPTGPELVTTAFQAAGELAQIGVSVWTQTLRRAIERLPKPPQP